MAPNNTSAEPAVASADQPLFDTDYDLERDLKTGETIVTEAVMKRALSGLAETNYKPIPYKKHFVYYKLIFVSIAHALAAYSITHFHLAKMETIIWSMAVAILSTTVGIQVGGK